MLTLRPHRIREENVPMATAWLLSACAEARGKQDLWLRQRPEILDVLRQQAIIQSAESSNRLEGVTVAPERLRAILVGGARPRDRSEEEVSGYRRALDWIFKLKRSVAMKPRILRHLRRLCQERSTGDAGEWKKRDNEIIEILPGGGRRVRFKPTAAQDAPAAVDELCRAYADTATAGRLPPLLLVATFVLDLLCIHPFRDGNGRVSRLAALFLLLEQGFEVGRYVSLEREVEETKEEYYQALEACSTGWHEGQNQVAPWWNYFLGMLRRAYKELETRVEQVGPAKHDLVRQAVRDLVGPFTLGELHARVPAASLPLVKKVLAVMKTAGQVRLTGRGRGARWETVDSSPPSE